jgi:glycosyltransferase involved in cell wall biosynthesis
MLLSLITPSHDTRWLPELWTSIQDAAGDVPFEWVIALNGQAQDADLPFEDPRIRIVRLPVPTSAGVGALKHLAFSMGRGDVLIELDHDDLLMPGSLDKIAKAFEDHAVDFVYSYWADFSDDDVLRTYNHPTVRTAWESDGWRFDEVDTPRGRVVHPIAWQPSAATFSTIQWAPNHVRAWRRTFYERVGGHSHQYELCDDLDLLQRTYLSGVCKLIPEVLYLYRTHGANTWAQNVDKIQKLSAQLYLERIERLVLRQAELAGLPAYDLGGAHNCAPGWTPIDLHDVEPRLRHDLSRAWPWPNGSVGAFRAHDFLEHLPLKQQTMRQIHSCLTEGGWLLSLTPSTDGRGAFQDPTHVSYWNENSWWYWTRAEQAKYIRNTDVRFRNIRTETYFPSDWHAQHHISYVAADLVALKGGNVEQETPGLRTFPKS